MFLKNYTSNVPVSQTIYRIEQVLIRCGVLGISKEYGPVGGSITALHFRIHDNGHEFSVRLPANEEKALDALWKDYCDRVENRRRVRKDFEEQARRTAWKIIQDWTEVQMSMIQMNQAEPAEVFLPYVWDGQSTVFHRLRDSGYKGLLTNGSQEG